MVLARCGTYIAHGNLVGDCFERLNCPRGLGVTAARRCSHMAGGALVVAIAHWYTRIAGGLWCLLLHTDEPALLEGFGGYV
jgi:hypothetical protein